MSNSNAIAEFWRSFTSNADALTKIASAEDPVYDEVLEKLQQIDAGLYFEFSAKPGECELIITAEGDQSLFACVDTVVAAAPKIHGWKFFALKPKLGFPKTVEWDGCKITIAEVVFDPLEDDSGNLGLQLLVPGISDEDTENAHNALLRALDHGLGERAFAEEIAFTEVAVLGGAADEYIPLIDLDKYIQWNKKKKSAR